MSRVNREALACISVGIITFVISMIISAWYTEGDQVGYRSAYELARGLGLQEGRVLYDTQITSAEGVHFWFVVLGGILDINKNLLMSVFNGILSAYVLLLFLRWGANFWLAIVIVMTNYYLYVLYFAAERLKFAVLFLVLALLSKQTRIKCIIFLMTSLFAHLSIFFIYGGFILVSLFNKVAMWRSDKSFAMIFLLGILIPLLFLTTNFEYLFWKLNIYIARAGEFNVFNLMPALILGGFSLLYTDRYKNVALQFLPVVIGIALLGGDRLNMFAFFIFLYYGIPFRGGLNFGVLTTMIYLSYKTTIFIASIFNTGQGF